MSNQRCTSCHKDTAEGSPAKCGQCRKKDMEFGLMDKDFEYERCPHYQFDSHVKIVRCYDTGNFIAYLTIHCVDCKIPMKFQGLMPGLDMNGIACSPDQLEARLSIIPNDKQKPFQLLKGSY